MSFIMLEYLGCSEHLEVISFFAIIVFGLQFNTEKFDLEMNLGFNIHCCITQFLEDRSIFSQ